MVASPTCCRMQQMSRCVSRAWSRPQSPEVRGDMTNSSSSEADLLSFDRMPRLFRVLWWNELMLKERREAFDQNVLVVIRCPSDLTRCLLASCCLNGKCHHLR